MPPSGARRGGALAGRRVVITRPRRDAATWAAAIVAAGGEVVWAPCIAVRRLPASAARLQRVRRGLAEARWLALASPRAVAALAALMERGGMALPRRLRLVAVGPATAEAAWQAWRRRAQLSTPATAAGMAAQLVAASRGSERQAVGRVVFAPGALCPRPELAAALTQAGLTVWREPLYRTAPVRGVLPSLRLSDVVVFASPSAVAAWCGRAAMPAAPVVAIGPTTAAAAHRAGACRMVVARSPAAAGVVEALILAADRDGG